MKREGSQVRWLAFIGVMGCFFLNSIALSDVIVNYGNISLAYGSPGICASDTFDLTVGDVELSFTINASGVSGDWTYYAKVGLTSSTMYEGNFYGPESAYGGIQMLVGNHQDSCDVDTSEKLALKNSNDGDWESLYDANGPDSICSPVGLTDENNPLGRFHNMWFDRGGYEWTSITPRTVSGVNVVTNGIYHVKITYHMVNSNTATMFATINDENQGFYTQGYWNSHVDPCGVVREMPDVKPIGLSFHTDVRKLKIFAGTQSINDAGAAAITDLNVKQQELYLELNTLADFADAWLCSQGDTYFNGRFDYVTDNIINFSDFAVFANNFTGLSRLYSQPNDPCYNENCIQWKLNDNSSDNVVVGNDVNAQFIDLDPCANDYTSDVASIVNGSGAFHLNGRTQYVCVTVPNVWPSAAANLWTKSASNPVIGFNFYSYYGQLAPNPAGGWYFFGGRSFQGKVGVWRWDSNDLVTWSNPVKVLDSGGAGAWDRWIHVASAFQKPDGTWIMLYRGYDGYNYRMGKATSTDGTNFVRKDNGGVNDGLFPQFGKNYDPVGIILVDGIYYVYANGDWTHGVQNVYYSTDDFETFTAYSGNPILPVGGSNSDYGDFCSHIWHYDGWYYLLVPRDFYTHGTNLYDHTIGLYRSKTPIFDAESREFLGYPIVNDQIYDQRYLDTPSVPTTNVYRTTYAPEFGNTLYCLYNGLSANGNGQSLAYTTLDELKQRTPKVHKLFGEKQSYSFWVQFDTLTNGETVFSVGSSPWDWSPVWLCCVKTSGANKVLALYLGGNYRLSTTALSINTPYHVVIVERLDRIEMYINGQPAGFSYTQNNTATDDNYLYMGAGFGGGYLSGYMWDFRIYPAALDITQADKLYRTGSIK